MPPANLSSASAVGPEATSPLFEWLDHRAAGVLLHPSSLPSPFGIGAFDDAAKQFLEFLADGGFHYWQLCPLGPTGYGDSPYQCFSSFAGNPYFIDPAALVDAGLLTEAAVQGLRGLSPDRVDFGGLYQRKLPLLFSAHAAWRRDPTRPLPYGDFTRFQDENADWLGGFAFFSALKEHFEGRPWWEWPESVRSLSAANRSPLRAELAPRSEAYAFVQYLFFGQ